MCIRDSHKATHLQSYTIPHEHKYIDSEKEKRLNYSRCFRSFIQNDMSVLDKIFFYETFISDGKCVNPHTLDELKTML